MNLARKNAVSTHFIVVETKAEDFKVVCMAPETSPHLLSTFYALSPGSSRYDV